MVSANEIITKTGADAVELKGGADFAPHVKCLVEPVAASIANRHK